MAARNLAFLLLLVVFPCVAFGCRALQSTPLGDARLTALADDPEACQACMWGIRLMDDALCDRGLIYSVVNFVNQRICTIAKDKQQCESLSSALVPVALAYLQGAIVPGQICSSAGVCGKKVLTYPEYMQARPLPVGGVVECQFCRLIVAKVKEVLDNPESEQQVLDEALKVCKSLEPALQDACADFVNKNGAAFFAFIDAMEPLQLCEAAGACMADLIRNHPVPRLPAPLATSLARVQRASTPAPGNNLCDTCKIVVLEAHQMITNPKTQQQIEAFLEQACSSFGSAADECQALLEEYLPLALEVLAQYLDPESLCSQIGYCTKASALEQLVGALRVRSLPVALPRAARVHATQ